MPNVTPATLYPKPKSLRLSRGVFDGSDCKWITADPSFSITFKRRLARWAEDFKPALGFRLRPAPYRKNKPAVLAHVEKASKGIAAQGYRLTISEGGIRVRAKDEAGAVYGLQTLAQIARDNWPEMPCLNIADSPDFESRGLMMDISRTKVPKIQTLCSIIDQLAKLRINQLQLYIEHTFAWKDHETVWRDASPLTAENLKFLDAYCSDRYIELVPCMNSLAHMERWLRHDEYKHLADSPDGCDHPWRKGVPYGDLLRPDRQSLKFIDSLYAEFLPNFSSRLFNVGCDEAVTLGYGWSKTLCKGKSVASVYLDYLGGIHELVHIYGRRMMFWSDIAAKHPAMLKKLPKGAIPLEWGYEREHPFGRRCAAYARNRIPYYVCPSTTTFKSLVGRTGVCLENHIQASTNGSERGAIGYLNTDWGDGGHLHYWPLSWFGVMAGACSSWRAGSADKKSVVDACNKLIFQDATGKTGNVIYEMGVVQDLLESEMEYGGIFFRMLTAPISRRDVPPGVKTAGIRKCLTRFDELCAELGAARPQCLDASLTKDEIRNNIAMARLACTRTLGALDKRNAAPLRLANLRKKIVAEHKRLWMTRNRPGGLKESLGYIPE